jgi:hypothetical protein
MKKKVFLESLLAALVERGIDSAEITKEGSHDVLRWQCRDSVFIIGTDRKTGESYSLVDIVKL